MPQKNVYIAKPISSLRICRFSSHLQCFCVMSVTSYVMELSLFPQTLKHAKEFTVNMEHFL